MKRKLKKGLMCILIVLLLMNFVSASVADVCYATGTGGAQEILDLANHFLTGFVGMITWVVRAPVMAIIIALNTLLTGLAKLGVGEVNGYGDLANYFFISPFHVFFNKIPILDVNFFNFDGVSGTVLKFREAVAIWYYTMRLIASMVLAVILIYIGIRMAISTIASEKAMYKKMLVDWITSLALLFLLHYIMLFTFACNDALIKAVENICTEMDLTNIIGNLTKAAFDIDAIKGIAAMALYGILVWQTFTFIFAYIKRMLTIGFLIMIAPLITITYSIDKIGDGKAQALNTWLKEFVYNILIQPFHCIMFAAFAGVAFDLIGTGDWEFFNGTSTGAPISALILAICCMMFIKTGEELIRKIFGFGNASSLSTFVGGAAITAAAMTQGGKLAAGAGAVAAKGKNFISKHGTDLSKATKGISEKVGNATGKLGSVASRFEKIDSQGNLTSYGKKYAEKQAQKMTDKQKAANPGAFKNDTDNSKYAAAHEANYNKVVSGMTQKFTSKNNSIRKKAEEKENKRQEKQKKIAEKEDEQAIALARQKKMAKGDKTEVTEAEKESARKEIRAQKQEKKEKQAERREKRAEKMEKASSELREIHGVVGSFMNKNGKKIASGAVGVATAMIGLGNGPAGAIAGYNIGSGFMTGYLKNTNATMQKDNSEIAQALVNMNSGDPNFDIEAKTFSVYASLENGEFDKIGDKFNEILAKLQTLSLGSNSANFKNEVDKKLAMDPTNLNMDFLDEMLDKYNVDDSDRDEVLAEMKKLVILSAERKFAGSIQTSVGNGWDLEDVANMVARGVTAPIQTTNVIEREEIHTETHTEHITETEADSEENERLSQTADSFNRSAEDVIREADELRRLNENTRNNAGTQDSGSTPRPIRQNNTNIDDDDNDDILF